LTPSHTVTAWNIITGEYPPQLGGVSDYTRLVAEGLADAGDDVRIWAPPVSGPDPSSHHSVRVNRLPDQFGTSSLKILAHELERDRTARVLVEYVPHAFRMKAMNVPLCLMLLRRRSNDITVMFHEVAYPISRNQSIRHNALGVLNHAMAAILTRAASRIFVAAQGWTGIVARYAPKGRKIGWLPVPSTIPVVRDRAATLAVRSRFATPESGLLGHFGTYGPWVASRLKPALESILSTHQAARVLLIGRNGERFHDDFVRDHPALASRVFATGALATTGKYTESIWLPSGAVFLAPDRDAEALAQGTIGLLNDRDRAKTMGCDAVRLYREVFDLEHTIAALRAS
jgi:hypothetical protein